MLSILVELCPIFKVGWIYYMSVLNNSLLTNFTHHFLGLSRNLGFEGAELVDLRLLNCDKVLLLLKLISFPVES
jgi:hypothetical protein